LAKASLGLFCSLTYGCVSRANFCKTSDSLTEIEGKIAELSGKMDGYGQRLEQQKFVSRGAVVALVVGITSGLIKYLFFTI
jgi:hypothetical protein